MPSAGCWFLTPARWRLPSLCPGSRLLSKKGYEIFWFHTLPLSIHYTVKIDKAQYIPCDSLYCFPWQENGSSSLDISIHPWCRSSRGCPVNKVSVKWPRSWWSRPSLTHPPQKLWPWAESASSVIRLFLFPHVIQEEVSILLLAKPEIISRHTERKVKHATGSENSLCFCFLRGRSIGGALSYRRIGEGYRRSRSRLPLYQVPSRALHCSHIQGENVAVHGRSLGKWYEVQSFQLSSFRHVDRTYRPFISRLSQSRPTPIRARSVLIHFWSCNSRYALAKPYRVCSFLQIQIQGKQNREWRCRYSPPKPDCPQMAPSPRLNR